MEKIKVAIVGYGNVGRGVHCAVDRNPDMELVQIITRDPDRVKKHVKKIPVYAIGDFKKTADIAILCCGSKDDIFGAASRAKHFKVRINDPEINGQGPYFAQFFNTVDSFDTHARIPAYHAAMEHYAAGNRHTAIISAGWDPGTFSLERVMADAFIPEARHYTFWGPGVSQGHSDAVRSIQGVLDARQYTLPVDSAMRRVRKCANPRLRSCDKHTRLVYVVAHKGASRKKIVKEIKLMPHYFSEYDTKVVFISESEMMKKHSHYPHGGFVMATNQKGVGSRALLEYRCEWGSNAEATGNILTACARACFRMNRAKKYGAFTMLDLPAAYFSLHSKRKLLAEYM